MGRFGKLTLEAMSDEQRAIAERALCGPRGKLGTLEIWLRSPGAADPVERLGNYARFGRALPDRLKELAILLVARHLTSAYPWSLHYGLALDAQVAKSTVDAIAFGQRPTHMPPDEACIHDLVQALLHGADLDDRSYANAVNTVGEKGIIDLVALIGYYQMVCMVKNIDRTPAVAGDAPPL